MQSEWTLLNDHTQVLVVDDQRSTTMLVRAILDRVGYRVDECATGHEAITALSRVRYDLIVLDLNLPDMSGLDLLRDWKTPGLPPVLGITSGVTPELLECAESAGMNRVMEKPISSPQLIAAVVAAIRDTRSAEIVACGGPAIDPLVLGEIRNDNGDTLFHRFVEQAIIDAWQCIDTMECVSESDIAIWRQHVRALDGVARSIGARRLVSAIDEALPMSVTRLDALVGAITRQFADLLGEAQEALGEWVRPRANAIRPRPESAQLSERERTILHWTAAGKTSSETAAILGISGRTVAFHTANILFKLNAVNKTQAVAKAVMLDLLN